MAGPFTLAPEKEQSSNTEQRKPANAAHRPVRVAKSALLAPILNPGKAGEHEPHMLTLRPDAA